MPVAKDSEAQPETQKNSTEAIKDVAALPPARRPRFFLWILLLLLLAAFAWVLTSNNPFAEAIQEFAGNKHDQAILDAPFSIPPHSFRFYKFSLREGSTSVAIIGDFIASPEPRNRKGAVGVTSPESESGVEAYVLSESAFAVWQTGYATTSVFESGRVQQGKIKADLPAGAGVYYLVFNNKFASKSGKKVNATVLLHYKSWLPDWLRNLNSEYLRNPPAPL